MTINVLLVDDESMIRAGLRLVLETDTGILRCLTRTFGSEALKAQVSVRGAKGKEVAKGESDEQGLYEIKLPPGSYQVIITASGYRSHRRSVNVSSNGVAPQACDAHP